MNPTLVVWLQLTGLVAAEVAVIVGIAAQTQRLIKSAAWRRTLWHTCVLGLLLLVTFEFTGVARGFIGWSGKRSGAAKPIPVRIKETILPVSLGHNAATFQPRADFQLVPEIHAAPNAQAAPNNFVARLNKITTSSTTAATTGESFSALWIVLIWFAGAAFILGRAFVSRLFLEILRWRHVVVEDGKSPETIAALASRLGIRRRVRLMESTRICSPAAFGILRPTIGLPLQFHRKYNAAQQEAMLVHELAHLAENDPAWYLLADILTAALWWHPLTWWARRQMHAQSELAADEASLLVANGPGVLAECLVELGARLARTRAALPLGVAGNGFRSGLGRRVERLVKLEGSAWRPPGRIRRGLAVMIGPVALVTAAILCTAWVVPPALNKGENMQTMKQMWKKSLAAFALLASLSPDGDRALAQSATGQSATATEIVVTDAEQATSAAQPGVFAGPATVDYKVSGSSGSSGRVVTIDRLAVSKEQQAIEEKLARIRIDSIHYDGLPLSDVVNNLITICEKKDRDGVNFVLNREAPISATTPGAIDPATGLPQPAPTENPDLNSVTVHINPPLKNVRLIDVLDAITKTADRPIHFTIEDYGVLFSLGPKPKEEQRQISFQDRLGKAVRQAANGNTVPWGLEVMMFKVDTNMFFANLERTFGEKPLNDRPSQIRATLMDIFQKSFGIKFEGQDKTLFYNDANGVIMVRGTSQDVAAMRGAIEMLGGAPYSESEAATDQRDREYKRMLRDKTGSGSSGGGGGGAGPKRSDAGRPFEWGPAVSAGGDASKRSDADRYPEWGPGVSAGGASQKPSGDQ